jgi:hypothetical protein
MADIMTPVSPGELLDKITILRIKAERIGDAQKRANVRVELEALEAVAAAHVPESDEVVRLTAELQAVNAELWVIEDDIRDCERAGDFGPRFVALARAVYVTNDRRAAAKKAINLLLDSRIVEEKSYRPY